MLAWARTGLSEAAASTEAVTGRLPPGLDPEWSPRRAKATDGPRLRARSALRERAPRPPSCCGSASAAAGRGVGPLAIGTGGPFACCCRTSASMASSCASADGWMSTEADDATDGSSAVEDGCPMEKVPDDKPPARAGTARIRALDPLVAGDDPEAIPKEAVPSGDDILPVVVGLDALVVLRLITSKIGLLNDVELHSAMARKQRVRLAGVPGSFPVKIHDLSHMSHEGSQSTVQVCHLLYLSCVRLSASVCRSINCACLCPSVPVCVCQCLSASV